MLVPMTTKDVLKMFWDMFLDKVGIRKIPYGSPMQEVKVKK